MKRFLLASLVAFSLSMMGTAYAHPELMQTSPAADSTIPSPAKIELRFSERMVSAFSGAELFMVDMPGMKMDEPSREAATVAVSAAGLTLTLSPEKPLPPGTYRVDYHVASADTHRMTGSFSFRVK
jgi:methionine-rich copper-binding protein CopC